MANHKHRTPNSRTRAAYLRGRLLERRRMLLTERPAGTTSHNMRYSNEYADVLDAANDSLEQEISFRVAEIRSDEMLQVDEALRRISEGTYGVCEMCGRSIPVARLQALPSASMCVQCQREHESRSKEEATVERWDRISEMPVDGPPARSLAHACPRS